MTYLKRERLAMPALARVATAAAICILATSTASAAFGDGNDCPSGGEDGDYVDLADNGISASGYSSYSHAQVVQVGWIQFFGNNVVALCQNNTLHIAFNQDYEAIYVSSTGELLENIVFEGTSSGDYILTDGSNWNANCGNVFFRELEVTSDLIICGMSGHDRIQSGNFGTHGTYLYGNYGNDLLEYDVREDGALIYLRGGNGNDTLDADGDFDGTSSAPNRCRLYGGPGNDTLEDGYYQRGDSGTDVCAGSLNSAYRINPYLHIYPTCEYCGILEGSCDPDWL